MNIVVLDGHTLNPGDLTWSKLEGIGKVKVYERTFVDEVYERSKEADIILTNKVVLNKEMIQQLPRLKYIGVMATGHNVIDIATASKNDIIVTNAPGYSTDFVAQHTFALILELYNRVEEHNKSVQNGKWNSSLDFSYTTQTIYELSNKTMGIIGYGTIGKRVHEIASAFNMNILIYSSFANQYTGSGIDFVDLNTIFKESDIISIHSSLKKGNEGMINNDYLSLMKPTSYIINTSRGPIINEGDLANILRNKKIAGAALDVLSSEPPQKNNPLIGLDNCILTPHIAWASQEARSRLMDIICDNIQSYMEGKPKNQVS